ncbi:MAG: APC family permease [Methanomicrobiaceae archaeon]|nr:APC family permease [Methanomicrobiaceae archaeon]
MSGKGTLGLKEVVAMGIGGMVSGGIYAVLGVAMRQAGNAVPFSFLLAGILTLLTAYSYLKLTLHFKENGGAFSFIEHTVENRHIAGFFGWVLIVGYIGVMALYAFAFGSYLVSLFGYSPDSLARQLISAGIIAAFIGLNLKGIRESGLFQDIAVYLKIAFLLSIAGLGIYFAQNTAEVMGNFFNKGVTSSIAAFAIIFVAYEGFQLLIYDFHVIRDVKKTLPRSMYIVIILAICIYISVSFMATLHLSPSEVVAREEFALAAAVTPFIGSVGFTLVVISAMQSTASGINATLFGSARLAHTIATEKELPRVFSFRDKRGIPTRSLLIMGALTAAFAFFGTLEEITTFGSIIFLIADGAANYANLRLYRDTGSHPLIPAAGLSGCVIATIIVLYHLLITQMHILVSIATILVVMVILEFFFIERGPIKEAIT